jgi:hypothetical protein
MVKATQSLRKISLTTIVMVLTVVTISSTVFSNATVPVAFGQRIVIDSEQSVTVSTNGIDQSNAIDTHTHKLAKDISKSRK